MTLMDQINATNIETLRRRGSLKWANEPQHLGAFIAEMDFGTAPAVEAALHDAIERCGYGYLPEHLTGQMRRAFADFAQERYGWELAPESIEPLPDVLSALEFALRFLTRPGSAVVVPTPAYMPFLQIPTEMGRPIIQVPHVRVNGRYELDLDGLDAALAQNGGLLVLCNPHNPSGRVYSRAELEAVEALVARHEGVRVFCDEIHAPVVLAGTQHVPFAALSPVAARQAITATSTSKAFGLPGLKCAQLVLSNEEDRAQWAAHGERTYKLTSTVGVCANTAAYREGGAWLDEVLEYLDTERDLLVSLVAKHLPGVTMDRPEATYIGWLDCSALNLGEPPAAFFRREAGVALSDGAPCGQGYENHVRLVYATPEPILIQMLERMGQALAARTA